VCAVVTEISLGPTNLQEAHLLQTERMSHYVCKFVLSHEVWKGFKPQNLPSRSFKGIGNGAIR